MVPQQLLILRTHIETQAKKLFTMDGCFMPSPAVSGAPLPKALGAKELPERDSSSSLPGVTQRDCTVRDGHAQTCAHRI